MRQGAYRADGEAAGGVLLEKKKVVAEGGKVVRSKKKEAGLRAGGSRAEHKVWWQIEQE